MSKNEDEINKKTKKKLPVWKLICIDAGAFLISMGVFMYFDYLRPQVSNIKGTTIVSETDMDSSFALPEATEDSSNTQNSDTGDSSSTENAQDTEDTSDTENTGNDNVSNSHKGFGSHGGMSGSRSNTSTTQIQSDTSDFSIADATVTTVNSYRDDNIQITVYKKEVGDGNDKVTYYAADIYVTNVKYLKTAFANGSYGKNITDTVENMAEENDAILAVNGDFYGNSEEGVVIRNGTLYRSDLNDADICVLFSDGTMKTYQPSEFDADKVIEEGAWQAWTFGPELLDGSGNVNTSFNTTSYLNSDNPRCAIGYVEKGHYMIVAVDGRNEGYSRGVTLSELADIMSQEGCQTAYNMDGGKSVSMYFQGTCVNEPVDGGRKVSDIVYIGE